MRKWIDLGARLLLGLLFFVLGLNGFLHVLPVPEMTGTAGQLMGAFAATGYFLPVVKATEVVAGALLLAGRFVPLALVLLAPIVVQVFLFHAFLAPSGLPLAIVLVALEAWLGFVVFRSSFAGVLRARPAGS